jgi:hypothetical protein
MTDVVYGYRADNSAVTREYAERNMSSWFRECVSFTETGQAVANMTAELLGQSGMINSMDNLKSEAARLKSQLV